MNEKTFRLIKKKLNGVRDLLIPYLPLFRKLQLYLSTFKAYFCHVFYKQKNGYQKYSVVVACYNVEQYLEDFFKSFEYQSLDFRNNFQLVMVDDGSTDKTKAVIQKWVKKYPQNIEYLYQSNQGQASARNLGLNCIKYPWVSFIDPDDFLDCNAFRNIDSYLEKFQGNLDFVSMHIIPFYEDGIGFVDNHPLSFKHLTTSIRDIAQIDDFIQLSAASGLFKSEVIKDNDLKFNPDCRPSFEDALFVNQYFLKCMNGKIIFAKDVVYFYRKRMTKDSTLDNSINQKGYFIDVFKYGVLPLIKQAKQSCDHVPIFIQNVAAYHSLWFLKNLINHPNIGNFLTKDEKALSRSLLKEVFESLPDIEKICHFNLLGWTPFLRQCVANLIGLHKLCLPEVMIRKFDFKNNELLLEYSGKSFRDDVFWEDNKTIIPRYSKVADDTFLDGVINQRRYVWLPLNKGSALSYRINNFYSNKFVLQNDDGSTSELTVPSQNFSEFTNRFNLNRPQLWLICDRDRVADDNGEHFYRYLLKNHSEINAYFLLNKDSPDWQRLKSEGFKLIALGSLKHHNYLRKCTCIISSHADPYVFDYFKDGCARDVPFVFLQHGVTKDDISEWLNPIDINLMIATSRQEYNSLVDDHGRYKFTKKEVKLLGMPRHDSLLQKNKPSKMILVMPTWRKSIVGQYVTKGNKRNLNAGFYQTRYAKAWLSMLCSQEFENLVKQFCYQVVFSPHENVRPYFLKSHLPKYIRFPAETEKMQDLFGQCSLLITDYSSVAFEIAYLNKPVIYFQFDRTDVLSNHSHIYVPGYYSYEKNGFGDVVLTEEVLFLKLLNALKNNAKIEDKYLKRAHSTFLYKDGLNCQRVLDAIRCL